MEFVGINLLDSGSIFLPITEENETPGRDREKNFWRLHQQYGGTELLAIFLLFSSANNRGTWINWSRSREKFLAKRRQSVSIDV